MYLSWLNHVLAPWQWPLPATELLVLQALANLAMLRLLVELHGRRWGILPPLALFLFSVISLEGTVWWAAGLNALPFEIALLLALTAHLRYLRSGRLRHAWQANGWVVLGFLFYEKSALIYLAIAVFTLCWFSEGYGWRRVASAVRGRIGCAGGLRRHGRRVRRHLPRGWQGLHGRPGPPSSHLRRGARPWSCTSTCPRSWEAQCCGTSSGCSARPAPATRSSSPAWSPWGWCSTSCCDTAGCAARALVMPVAFLVVDVVLVLLTRSGDDALFVFDYRFQGEMAAITAIALAAMSMPIDGAATSSVRRSGSELLDHPRRVAVLVVAVTGLALLSTVRWIAIWHSDDRAQAVGAVRDGLTPAVGGTGLPGRSCGPGSS